MLASDLASLYESILGLPPNTLLVEANSQGEALVSGLAKNPNPKAPILEDAMMRSAGRIAEPTLQKWFWPEGRPFCVVLSHDVDEVRWSWRRRLLMASRHPPTLLERNDHYWNFDRVVALERRFGVSSCWYFVADGGHPRDPPYRLRDVQAIIGELDGKGHEVGVHGSYLSYRDRELLRGQRQAIRDVLGRPVPGIRQHFLNFEAPLTWEIQETVGFAYDATLGLNETSGFRTGLCHPYWPPNRHILELPLVIMDGQLFWYEKFSNSEAIENCEKIAEDVRARGGLLTLNWHQHTYDGYSFPGWWDVYEHMLRWFVAHGALFLTGEQVWRWWKAREGVEIVATERLRNRATWEIMSSEDISGLAVRVLGRSGATLRADAEYRITEGGGGVVLVLAKLRPRDPVTIIAEW